jgi:hypothetical protein
MDPAAFTPTDPRNRPNAVQWLVYQWLRAGLPLGTALRVEVEQSLGYRSGADDRGRWPAGGLNPYVAPLAGAFWAYFHSASFLAAGAGLRHTLGGFEWGPFVTALDVVDPNRIGADERHSFWGAGLLVDWRSGPWQLDLRGGYSPNLATFAPAARPWSIFLGVGWGR